MAVSTVKVTINGQTYNLSYNSTSGKWEATITAPSTTSYNVNAEHYYPVSVQATDQAGNTTQKDDNDATLGDSLKLYVKERVKPTITVLSPSSGARITNAQPTIEFRLRDEDNGSGIDITTLSLSIDGGAAVGHTAPGMTVNSVTGGYDCTYTPQSALSEGAHSISINIKDHDGNSADTATVSFTVDTAPPALNVSSPSEGLITKNATLSVQGTTNDDTSTPVTITISLNGVDQGPVTVSSGSFSKSITLAEGENTIVVTATDAAGLSSQVTRHVTLDTVAPTIESVTINPNPADAGQTFVITVMVSDPQ